MTAGRPDDADALPEPPFDLAKRKLPIVRRPPGESFVRLHRETDGAIWFGWDNAAAAFRMPTNRFDSMDRSFGVLYLAETRDGAFAESVGRKPQTFRSDDELATLLLTNVVLQRELRLVDLHGGAAVGAIAATGVVGVGPQSLARRWSQALHEHPELPDGIEYRCRHNSDELALGLFDRVGDTAVLPTSYTTVIADRSWLSDMRERHQIWQPPS